MVVFFGDTRWNIVSSVIPILTLFIVKIIYVEDKKNNRCNQKKRWMKMQTGCIGNVVRQLLR
jgi:hypothetical protein